MRSRIPVLQAHQKARAQHLGCGNAAATLVQLIQAAQEVVAHPIDQRRLLIEKASAGGMLPRGSAGDL
jgi:hypothetical protein